MTDDKNAIDGVSEMSEDKERLYEERLKRYTTAMRNGKPDRIPLRIFARICQQVCWDHQSGSAV